MREAVVLCGVQASGKTSYYRRHLSDTHLRISLDMLHTRRREGLILAACLEAGQSFAIDNTNPLRSDRARYIGPAHQAQFRIVGYFFRSTVEDALRRNALRSGKQRIPDRGIIGTFRKFEVPALEEGFDELHIIELAPNYEFALISNASR